MYQTPCPKCNQLQSYRDEDLGRESRCAKCSHKFTFPAERPEVLELPDDDSPAEDRYEFACPNCRSQLETNTAAIGRQVTCSECKQRVRVPDPDKSATSSSASKIKENDVSTFDYRMACVALGIFLLAGLVINIVWSLGQLELMRESKYYVVDEVGARAVVVCYAIWCVGAVTVMFGYRWLVWSILLISVSMFVFNAAFTLGGAMELNFASIYRLVLFGGATLFSLRCIHELQLIKRRRHSRLV